uniref:Thioredoxin domain-containing protein n=1 Tax=viral metagenome TaxID=1070528 RepID=A0A6C0I2Y8_9ZZZZ
MPAPINIVLIHADWCGHCKALMPHFKKAKEELRKSDPDIKVISITDKEVTPAKLKSIHKDLDVKGYPTLVKIVNNILSQFGPNDGNRNSKQDLVKWAKKEKKKGGGNKTKCSRSPKNKTVKNMAKKLK